MMNYGDSALITAVACRVFRLHGSSGLFADPTLKSFTPTGRPMLLALRSASNAMTSVSIISNSPASDGNRSSSVPDP